MTKEFMVASATRNDALRRCRDAVRRYSNGRRYRYLIGPAAQHYQGRSKKLAGKWRCYARIVFSKS